MNKIKYWRKSFIFKTNEDINLIISGVTFCIYVAAFCIVEQNLNLTNFLLYIMAAAIVTLSKMLFLRDHQQLWARTSCVLGLVIGVLLILGVIYFAPDYYIPKFALFITIFNAAIFSALSLRIEC